MEDDPGLMEKTTIPPLGTGVKIKSRLSTLLLVVSLVAASFSFTSNFERFSGVSFPEGATIYCSGYIMTRPLISHAPFFFVILLFMLRNVLLVQLFLPAIWIGGCEPVQRAARWVKMLQSSPNYVPFFAPTTDGLRIRGTLYLDPREEEKSNAQKRWVLYCNPNGVCYEDIMKQVVTMYSTPLSANLAMFNYRGVAGSGDGIWPRTAEDICTDSMAVLEYLVKVKEADPRLVLIVGHSMGGGTAAAIRRRHSPSGPIVSDRSFSSLLDAALFHCEGPMGLVIGVILGALSALIHIALYSVAPCRTQSLSPAITVFACASLLAQVGYFTYINRKDPMSTDRLTKTARNGLMGMLIILVAFVMLHQSTYGHRKRHGLHVFLLILQLLAVWEAIGLALWYSGWLLKAAPLVIRLINWELPAKKEWGALTGPKLVLYHPMDGVIPPAASLFTALEKESQLEGTTALRLTKDFPHSCPMTLGQFCHTYELRYESTWESVIVKQLNGMFVGNVSEQP